MGKIISFIKANKLISVIITILTISLVVTTATTIVLLNHNEDTTMNDSNNNDKVITNDKEQNNENNSSENITNSNTNSNVDDNNSITNNTNQNNNGNQTNNNQNTNTNNNNSNTNNNQNTNTNNNNSNTNNNQNTNTNNNPTNDIIEIENYIGKNYIEVKRTLEISGCQVLIKEKDSNSIEQDIVIEQSIPVGTKLNIGDTIILYIPNQKYPNFTTYTIDEVREFTHNHNITLNIEYKGTLEYKKGTIFYQSIPIGSEITDNQSLTIKVADTPSGKFTRINVDSHSTYVKALNIDTYFDLYVSMIDNNGNLIYGSLIESIEIYDIKDINNKSIFYPYVINGSSYYLEFFIPDLFVNMVNVAKNKNDCELIPVPRSMSYIPENQSAIHVSSNVIMSLLDN